MCGGMIDKEEQQPFIDQICADGAAACKIDTTDISNGLAARKMVQHMVEEFGGIDIVVNNAGIQHVAAVEDFPAEKWQAVLDVNLSAPFHISAAAIPEMRKSGWGRIINIASVHGQVASAHKSAYVAAKHGLIGLTKTIALELCDTQITCNAICPGWVRTPLVEAQIKARATISGKAVEQEALELVQEKQPTGRFMQPEQIADMALFLADEKAQNITGSAFPLDGGWTAQ